MGRPSSNAGKLTEYTIIVDKDVRDTLMGAFNQLDLTDLDDIAKAHQLIMASLLGGQISPEFAAEAREMLGSVTTLAAARAQNVFNTETPLDGAQSHAAAMAEAKARRGASDAETEEPELIVDV